MHGSTGLLRENWRSSRVYVCVSVRAHVCVCDVRIPVRTRAFLALHSSEPLSPSAILALELLNCNVIGFTCKATTMNY